MCELRLVSDNDFLGSHFTIAALSLLLHHTVADARGVDNAVCWGGLPPVRRRWPNRARLHLHRRWHPFLVWYTYPRYLVTSMIPVWLAAALYAQVGDVDVAWVVCCRSPAEWWWAPLVVGVRLAKSMVQLPLLLLRLLSSPFAVACLW